MFHKLNTMAEKACPLGPTKYKSLADGIYNMLSLLDLMRIDHIIGEQQNILN